MFLDFIDLGLALRLQVNLQLNELWSGSFYLAFKFSFVWVAEYDLVLDQHWHIWICSLVRFKGGGVGSNLLCFV